MRWNSIRVRLTLWNVAVLALILAALGGILCYSVQADVRGSVDRELQRSASESSERILRTRRRIRDAGPPRPFDRDGRRDRDRSPGGAGRSFGGAAAGALPGGPSGAPPFPGWTPGAPPAGLPPTGAARPGEPGTDPRTLEQERRDAFRRPRFFDPLGRRPGFFPGPEEPLDRDSFRLAVAGGPVYRDLLMDGVDFRVYTLPLRENGRLIGAVQVAHDMADQKRLNEGLIRRLLMLIPLGLVIAGLGGMFLTERALRPVRKVTQAAAQIGAEDLSRRLEVRGKDELAELSSTFNGMVARLEEAFQRIETAYQELGQAYDQQRRFSGDASHELRTPLTRIKASTSLALSKERTPDEYRRALEVADQAADTMNRIVQDLLLLARADGGQLAPERRAVPVDDLFRRAVAAAADLAHYPVDVDLPGSPLAVNGDPEQLTRLLVNLLENAARHTPRSGRIGLAAEHGPDGVRIHVSDTGEGIPAEHLPHVCERFYRVDPSRSRAGHSSGGGTGLGLSICQSIVEAHDGALAIESEVGRGTTVTVTLPAAEVPRPEPVLARV